MDKDPKGPRQKPPQGLFSGGGQAPSEPPPYDPHTAATPVPSIAGMSFPPEVAEAYGRQGAHEVVLEDLEDARNSVSAEAPRSSFPPPLGQSEGHDAWTVEHMHRQSTIPPVRHDDVDRLRELAAMHLPPAAVPSDDFMGNALDLVDRSRPSQQLDLVGEMEDLYALDDYAAAKARIFDRNERPSKAARITGASNSTGPFSWYSGMARRIRRGAGGGRAGAPRAGAPGCSSPRCRKPARS